MWHALFGLLVPLVSTDGTGALPRGAASAAATVGVAADPVVLRDEGGQIRGRTGRVVTGDVGLAVGLGWHVEALALAAAEWTAPRDMGGGLLGDREARLGL